MGFSLWFVLIPLLLAVSVAIAKQDGACDPERLTPQFLRDDTNHCVFYQCEYQGTSYLRAVKLECPLFNRVPSRYGKTPRYPDDSYPCSIYSRKNTLCELENQEWTTWSPWGSCSERCGAGYQYRTRRCLGGVDCPGDLMEKRECVGELCPDIDTPADSKI
ncbi:semaphorin-5A-like [Lingula anatina]|uniref:Semaphorin-5A-like n=1 Tax=Lingula anatina TaxID=7574 RepID=A0A1S3K877_LINAN|nr:semaphorin-5A-like [Lingula anatina]|eukprot:XP_013418461.1 semaphorin-5A-like [Lingula anatina]